MPLRRTFLAAFGVCVVALLAHPPAEAQDSSSVIIPRNVAESHGLRRAWLTQVEINGAQDRVQNVVYWIGEPPRAKKKPLVEAEPEILPKKEPMDLEAEIQALLPKPPPPPPVVLVEERPTLYVLSRRGVLHAIDAETGQTIWTTQVGSREKPNDGPGVGKLYVAVVNSNTLYVMDRRDGGLAFRKELTSVASAGPAVSNGWVYVPMLSGHIVAYKLPDVRLGAAAPPPVAAPAPKAGAPKAKDHSEREKKLRELQRDDYAAGRIESMTYTSFSPIIGTPLVTPDRIAWATARGQLYMGFNDRSHVDNRFDTLKPIEAPLMYWSPYIYAAARDGYVYGVHERKSDAPWRYSIGEPLYQPAVAVEDAVYAIGDLNGMFCLDAVSGNRRWWAPGIRRFLSVSAKRVYTVDNTGALQVLDRQSGAQFDRLAINRLDVQVLNQRSDRIYLGNASGVLQCLHEIGQTKPLTHFSAAAGDAKKDAKGPKIGGQPKSEEPKAEAPKADEPKAEPAKKADDAKEAKEAAKE